MGMYKYIRNAWKQPKQNMPELWKARLLEFRRDPSTIRIDKPTRIDAARNLGYKAKQGYLIIRQRVLKGGHVRPHELGGRRPKHSRLKLVLSKSYQQIAEERASKKYPNCEVLNSYYVAHDGNYLWYEIILIDASHPVILADRNINWITRNKHKGRANRGLTSSGRKSRGLRRKGKGAEKMRPSLHAHDR